MQKVIEFLRCYIQAIGDDEVGFRAAALAYWALFSIFPLLLLVVTVLGLIFQDQILQSDLIERVASLFPSGDEIIIDVVEGMFNSRTTTSILAIIGVLWSATGFFRGLVVSLHIIFGTERRPPTWKSRGIALIMVLFITPLFLLAIVLNTVSSRLLALPAIPDLLRTFLSLSANTGIMLFIVTLAFALLYGLVPSRRPGLKSTLIGAVCAALAIWLVTVGFNWYLDSGFAKYNIVYGSISTIIVLILYFYIVNFIILLGAEFTSHLSNTKDCTPMALPGSVERYINDRYQGGGGDGAPG